MLYRKKILGTIGYMGGLPALLESFCWAWGQLIQYNSEYMSSTPGEIIHYIKATASLHFFARNSLVQKMKGDWLLMLDTDHAPPPDLAVRMVEYMNRFDIKVATALYRHKSDPGSPVIYNWDEKGYALAIGDWDNSATAMQIDSAGAGALMVKREVFDRIRNELKEEPFSMLPNYGEDHSFFKRCQKLKIPVYALMTLESPHLKVEKLTMNNFQKPSGFSKRKEVKGFK